MKAILFPDLLEISFEDMSLVDEEGVIALSGVDDKLTFAYEEEDGKRALLVKAPDIRNLYRFLHFSDIPVRVII